MGLFLWKEPYISHPRDINITPAEIKLSTFSIESTNSVETNIDPRIALTYDRRISAKVYQRAIETAIKKGKYIPGIHTSLTKLGSTYTTIPPTTPQSKTRLTIFGIHLISSVYMGYNLVMDVFALVILIIVIFVGFTAIYLFFKSDLNALRQTLEGTKDSVSTSLAQNTQDINARLIRATEVIGELKREAGAFSEIGRGMRDLQEYLRSPKLRGNIGEMVLSDLLSQMFPKGSYHLQHSFKSGDKVDVAIKTGGGLLPVDSKFPMENFQKMHAVENEGEVEVYKKAFIRDIKTHIKAISSKYILPSEGTLDFALMYIPSESVFYEMVGEEKLMSYSRDLRVYPVSPNTLYAALQTILLSYEGQKIEEKAKEVFRMLRAIQKDHEKTAVDLSTLGTHINNAHNKFEDVSHGFNSLGQKLETTRALTGDEAKKIQDK